MDSTLQRLGVVCIATLYLAQKSFRVISIVGDGLYLATCQRARTDLGPLAICQLASCPVDIAYRTVGVHRQQRQK